jgi:hypothetical protein
MAVRTLVDEISWDAYGSPDIHSPVIRTDDDCRRLDTLVDVMGTLTRMMDTRIAFATTEGKVIKEWIETILELGGRYLRELEILERLEKKIDQ